MVEAQNESIDEKISPVTPGRWEKYHPRVDLGSLFRTAYKIFDVTPILIMVAVSGVISYSVTVNSDLPAPVRIGLGAALGLGLYYLIRKSPWPEDN